MFEEKLRIKGAKSLGGEVKISGAKNAVLKEMAAALILPKGKSILRNVPDLSDVNSMIEIMSLLGADVDYNGSVLEIDSTHLSSDLVPIELARKLRASFVCLGALVARFKKAQVALPGGCDLGARKVDLHLKGLRALGVTIREEQGYIFAEAEKLIGTKIYLDLPSNGATENIMLAACLAEGETIIENAARDPEIVDLANFLNSIGCKVSGAGSSNIQIQGVTLEDLHETDFDCLPDRIEAATYLIAAAMTKGKVRVNAVLEEDLQALLSKLEDTGVDIQIFNAEKNLVDILINAENKDLGATDVKTMWYPGFSTDIQPIFSALLCVCKGTSTVVENIYNSRFQHIEELHKMGAKADVNGEVAVINGVESLSGTQVEGRDLRATAALVVAALAAEGVSEVRGLKHLDRGYEHIVEKFKALGADIERVSDIVTETDEAVAAK
ncbi:MAG: UDP-N-acetylglucosamine 1-carboxyvinyltransferase [Candidatus Caenarcaniphilales bacterium]|nr:UDP-N-acetylglucosamine 1-carboxyvinyltransferase [Candidatus Caenarcaniphilales bacterium]